MLFYLLYPPINVVQYITFRTAAAGLTAFLISLLMGPWMIRTLREFQVGQVVRDELSTTHQLKAGTPTMGGLLILAATLVPTLLWSDLTNMTAERAAYDLDQVNADIETFFQSLEDSLSGISDADLETKKVLMHQRTSKVDEERTIDAILERTLNVHIKEHLAQLQELRDALAI